MKNNKELITIIVISAILIVGAIIQTICLVNIQKNTSQPKEVHNHYYNVNDLNEK